MRSRYPAFAGFASGLLDMNRPFRDQGIEPGSACLVYAVNTLHAAYDLGFTLGEALGALAPGALLVASECLRPPEPMYAEFIFNLMQAFRSPRLHPLYRPHGGFLALEHWKTALETAGFVHVRCLPDIARIQDEIPDFAVAAIGATRPG